MKREEHFERNSSTVQKINQLIINQDTRLKVKTPYTVHTQLLKSPELNHIAHTVHLGTMSVWFTIEGKKSMEAAKMPVPNVKFTQGVEQGYPNRRWFDGRRSILKVQRTVLSKLRLILKLSK